MNNNFRNTPEEIQNMNINFPIQSNNNPIDWKINTNENNNIHTGKDVTSSVLFKDNTNNQINLNNITLTINDSDMDFEEQEALRKTQLYNQQKMNRLKEKMEKELYLKKENIAKANKYVEKWITYYFT